MNLLRYTSEFKQNLRIAYPVMLGQLGHVLVGLADNLMVGKLGAPSLAAVSLGNGIIFIALSLGIGFTFAITPLIAEADGEKNVEKGRSYFQHGVFLSIILGILLFLVLLLAKPVLYYMKQPIEVVELAVPYFEVVAFSMIPLMIFQGFKQFADGLSLTKYAMQATIIANIINVIFNYLLIYGIWVFPKMGIVGAAYGTLFSRFAMLALLIVIMKSKAIFAPYLKGFSLLEIKEKILQRIFNLGYPTALQMWFEVGIFSSGIFLAGVIGTKAQAANQIALNLASMTFMIAVGLGVTATIRVGNQKGLKNYKELRRIALSIFVLMAAIDLLFAGGFILMKNILPTFYIHDVEVIEVAATLIVIAGFFQLSDGIQAVVLGALRGLQDVKIPMLITFVAYWVVGFPICYYLSLKTDLKAIGIWIGLLISLTVSAILLYIRFHQLTKKLIQTKKNNEIT
ncbi:MATE family efflux transporter [Tenacibaculum maritimum]|uniref:MATE family efflux transporter n=1 Tax=Tenacibaculum maritimum TaxID=107401 RepID=UPI0012E4A184|nr:MATE family efflux transporter [Tenacibaculum maritimum]CAA0177029.1 Multidrug resistance protein norM (Na(+)/drug antiporter) [Tenacibaculum maritimum]CAA0244356.1 Multidrug resistance protein norM (Na(+)/drug antiporter) [Tenacibaculum maritimum]CAA0252530.1 Multidrug resistance protein norM (Na(+)/drug antiporter) [Tenacibaculum maritimum]